MHALTCTLRKHGGGFETVTGVEVAVSADGNVELLYKHAAWTYCAVAARHGNTWAAAFGRSAPMREQDCVHLADLAFPLNLGMFAAGDTLLIGFDSNAEAGVECFLGFPPPDAVHVQCWLAFDRSACAAFQTALRAAHTVTPLHAWLHANVDTQWTVGAAGVPAAAAGAADAPFYARASTQCGVQAAEDPDCWSASEVVLSAKAAMARSIRTAKSCRSVCTPSDSDYGSGSDSGSIAGSDEEDGADNGTFTDDDDSGGSTSGGSTDGPDAEDDDAGDDDDGDDALANCDDGDEDGVANDDEDKDEDMDNNDDD